MATNTVAESLNISQLHIVMVAKVIVDMLSNGFCEAHTNLLILNDGRTVRRVFQQLPVSSEANSCADFLAKLGAEAVEDFLLFPCKPVAISKLVENGSRGFCIPLFVNCL